MSGNHSPQIGVIDYGVGNLHSITRALQARGAAVRIVDEPEGMAGLDGLVLPGVGAFAAGMHGLEVRGLTESVRQYANGGKPVLGICLGAQLLLSRGYEFGEHGGLDIIPGEVRLFPPLPQPEKIPHVGWNTIQPPAGQGWQEGILETIEPGTAFYFVHSYILLPTDPTAVFATTTYGGHTFCSVVRRGAVYGCQFHPEKSGEAGLCVIDSFIRQCQTLPI